MPCMIMEDLPEKSWLAALLVLLLLELLHWLEACECIDGIEETSNSFGQL